MDRMVIEKDFSFLRMQKTCNGLQNGRFSSPVRTDETNNFPLIHMKGDVLDCQKALITDRNIID
jgi:hypothetical protein